MGEKTLCIKGHYHRGKDVIKALENLGGKNEFGFSGYNNDEFYYIGNGVIYSGQLYRTIHFPHIMLSLEEFEKIRGTISPETKRKRVAKELDKLVGQRFNTKSLRDKLDTIFDENFILYNGDYREKCPYPDWCFTFAINFRCVLNSSCIVSNLQREKDDNGNTFYVTNVEYRFD